ncbi:hypothetical protein [Actinokineospora globicatena]|uniref:hypothetical protein n=1 Tax=Actinokineospora globicatena TaxID=103729 RepID=UPI0020A3850E|nr:hypothetical protein [Actinokineospora globicatena]MCP2300661.1 hypothetical protein [Actinokineospora globicatena]GLW81205.1 hypothetical protein Aglo01_56860 [Actinokineospora globicatena]GLW88398.1 hypothetical protein Aglo02_60370 [Actinokineospora globicatena]
MTTAFVLVTLLALLVLGLDRNHVRTATTPRSRLAGSTDAEDRDLLRVAAELRSAAPTRAREAVSARTAARVRPASATR